MSPTVRLAPSLLAADFSRLGEAIEELEDIVDVFHIDVMDGHFVPNIAMGPGLVESIRPLTAATFDVHLMVADPDPWVERYRGAGADWISVHWETARHLERTMSRIRELGARAGLALNPASRPGGLEYVLAEGDFLLVMSVNPGFAGQAFLPATPRKLASLRAELDDLGLVGVELEVDGGVGPDNAARCVEAGAGILVAGSSVCGADDPPAAARQILELARVGVR